VVNVVTRNALPATGDAGIATQHVTPLRLRVFAATQRPVAVHDVTIDTPWGSVRVRGRLGQRHADVYETIRRVACDQRTEPDGARVLLVDPADVRRGLGDGWYSAERIDALLDDLLHAVIDLRCPRGRARGHFIDQITETKVAVPARGGIQTEPRRLWRVRLGAVAVALDHWDLGLHYDPRPVTRLRSGVAQAVVRHVLTHSRDHQPRGGWTVDGLLDAVCGDLTPEARRNRRRELRADAEGMRRCGVLIEGDRVHRIDSEPVW